MAKRAPLSFDEIRVYDGVAERTGVNFERSAIRRSGGCCRSLTELIRKARAAGDGYFYLPLGMWPADSQQIELQKPWISMSSLSSPDAPDASD